MASPPSTNNEPVVQHWLVMASENVLFSFRIGYSDFPRSDLDVWMYPEGTEPESPTGIKKNQKKKELPRNRTSARPRRPRHPCQFMCLRSPHSISFQTNQRLSIAHRGKTTHIVITHVAQHLLVMDPPSRTLSYLNRIYPRRPIGSLASVHGGRR